MTFESNQAEQRARNLLPLAWANGEQAMQRGWWPYVNAEVGALERHAPGITQRFTNQLKAMRNEHGNG